MRRLGFVRRQGFGRAKRCITETVDAWCRAAIHSLSAH